MTSFKEVFMSKLSPDKMVFPAIDATANAEPGNNNDDDQDEPNTGAGGEPDTPPDCEEVVEVDPDEADALVDVGMGAAA